MISVRPKSEALSRSGEYKGNCKYKRRSFGSDSKGAVFTQVGTVVGVVRCQSSVVSRPKRDWCWERRVRPAAVRGEA